MLSNFCNVFKVNLWSLFISYIFCYNLVGFIHTGIVSWISINMAMTPFFRADPLLYHKFENMLFFRSENCIQFFHQKLMNRDIGRTFISIFFDKKKISHNPGFLGYKVYISFLTEKIPYSQMCRTKGYVL